LTDIFLPFLLSHCDSELLPERVLPKTYLRVANSFIAISACTDRNPASGKYGAIQVRPSADCSRRSSGRRSGCA